jgi:pectate lyase-like protein
MIYTKKVTLFMAVFLCLLYPLCSALISCNKINAIPASYVENKTISTTIPELRNNVIVTGNSVYYTSENGGGKWKFDSLDNTSTDNTGTVLVTKTGRRLKRIIDGPINVKWFGAKGDSLTDETDAFNNALIAVRNQQKDLYIPAGIYSCNKKDTYNHIIFFNAGGLNNITIYGDGASSKITTSVSNTSILFYASAYLKCKNFSVKNLFFESTHELTIAANQGIFLQGTKGDNFKNTIITQCKFEGFSSAVLGQGLSGLEISGNIFNAPKGHDNAQTNTNPAVFVWLFDNQNGYCSDIKIISNSANGFSGTVPVNTLSTKRPMDGFVYGTGYGFIISGNATQNFSEEHIAIAPQSTFPNTTSQIIITANNLDGNIPAGSMNQDGKTVHAANYGIRCDAGNSSITNNIINNFSTGIMVRTVADSLMREGLFTITGNILNAVNDNNILVKTGIAVQGNLKKRLHNIVIENNTITVSNVKCGGSFSGISLFDTDTASIENNIVNVTSLTSLNSRQNCGVSYGRVSMISDKNNVVTGILSYRVLSPATDQINFIKQ